MKGLLKIKSWYFLAALVLFTILVNILGTGNINRMSPYNDCLVELDDKSFLDSISSRLCFVLFYAENSDLCDKMNCNLNCMAKNKQSEAGFFKLNVEKYPHYNLKYNISGVPNTFIFKNGNEIKRIMGVVPERNMEIIYNKLM
jgi:thioredoxin-like negative regulator of GroEL